MIKFYPQLFFEGLNMTEQLKLYNVPKIGSIQEMVLRSTAKYSEKVALEDLQDFPIPKVTYNVLLKNIQKFGVALRQLGLKERSRIAIIGDNRVQWGITYLTAMCCNYIVIPIDKKLNENEILNIIHESESEAIVFTDEFAPMLRDRQSSLKKLKYYISMDLRSFKDGVHSMSEMIQNNRGCFVEELPKINSDDLAVILFTSGTLGRSKGVMLSQRNLASNLMAMVSMFFIYPEDRFLSVLPIHHTYECTCGFLCPLYCGSSVHYARSLKTIVEDLQNVHATILLAVPLLYDKMFKRIYKTIKENKLKSIMVPQLVRATNFVEKFGWKSAKKIIFKEIHHKFGGAVRTFITGGAPQDPVVAKGLRDFGFSFIQGYGLTETSPILALNRIDNFKDDSAGLPLPGVDIKINNPDSEGAGEIWAKGASVMLGYYKNDKATQEVIQDGWFKTGDLGYLDNDGFLHIRGRKKNVIISKSGKNVFPEEIEDVLNRSPFILESLVYGQKDPKQDEIIAAQIVVDAETFIEMAELKHIQITADLIQKVISDEIQRLNKQLSSYKQIKKFYIRDQEFEKTTAQKIKRYANQPA
jgi:long-chain acyl-CoA synthetase